LLLLLLLLLWFSLDSIDHHMSAVLVACPSDERNSKWKESSVGNKLLLKMGWKEGEGLGKRKEGTTAALRAIKRVGEDTLGIGASSQEDLLTGHSGWSQTQQQFHSVLQNLRKNDDNKKTKKKKKKRKKNGNKLILAQNKVTAGHSKKMRASKDLSTKSAEDMVAIFGGVPQQQQQQQQQTTMEGVDTSVLEHLRKRKTKEPKQQLDDDKCDNNKDAPDVQEKDTKNAEAECTRAEPKKKKKDRKKKKSSSKEKRDKKKSKKRSRADNGEVSQRKSKKKKVSNS